MTMMRRVKPVKRTISRVSKLYLQLFYHSVLDMELNHWPPGLIFPAARPQGI